MRYGHGSNTIRSEKKYWKGKGSICRLCCTSMEVIPYSHRSNTVRTYWQYRTSIKDISYKHRESCACTILCLCYLLIMRPCVLRSCSYNYILRGSTVRRLNTEDWYTSANLSTRNSDQAKNIRTKLETRTSTLIQEHGINKTNVYRWN